MVRRFCFCGNRNIIVLPTLIIRTIRDFATHWFRTLPGPLTHINGRTSIAIVSRRYISLYKRWTPHFSGDITDRSVIYPMGLPFCFRGNPNNNLLHIYNISICTYPSISTTHHINSQFRTWYCPTHVTHHNPAIPLIQFTHPQCHSPP